MSLESFEKFIFYSPDGCWYWLGGVQTKGYGHFRNKTAHRTAYFLYKNVDPGQLCVCHSCDNRLCVNPDHLWLGTHADNVRDKVSKGRQSRRGANSKTSIIKNPNCIPILKIYGCMEQVEVVGQVKRYRNFLLWRFRCNNCGAEEIAHARQIRRRKIKCKNC